MELSPWLLTLVASLSSRWGEGSTNGRSMEMATILFRSLRPTFAKAFAGVLAAVTVYSGGRSLRQREGAKDSGGGSMMIATDDDQPYLAREPAAQSAFNEPGGAAPPRYLP